MGEIPADRPRSAYCKDGHRVAQSRKVAKARTRAGLANKDPVHIAKIKKLAFNDSPTELANFVRELFEDSVRSQIDDHIRDNLLGMTEVLVDMGPQALAALQVDLKSEDDYIRSRAYALWFKYVIPMQQKRDNEEDGSGNVTVVLATPFSEKVQQALNAHSDEVIDVSDWVKCSICHAVKHPDAMRVRDKKREMCTTCYWKRKAKSGNMNPHSTDPLFG